MGGSAGSGGVGLLLFETFLALVGVCLLAVVVLRWAAGRGLGAAGRGRAIAVLDRVALDARRSIVVVRVPGRLLLLGVGEGGAPTLLTELDEGAWPAEEPPAPSEFRKLLGKSQPSGAD
mgnify:CR=1 FL=1